jgi:hypothetical protein
VPIWHQVVEPRMALFAIALADPSQGLFTHGTCGIIGARCGKYRGNRPLALGTLSRRGVQGYRLLKR